MNQSYIHGQNLLHISAKQYLHRLVYYDETDDIGRAIEREKQLKGWTSQKKVALIESINPRWKDLSKDWYS